MAADGVTLYFSSDRPCKDCRDGTWGGDDIYMSRITDSGFTKPKILPPPFNSQYGDYGFSISPDGETAYFVSNRSGKSRFYQVKLRPQDSAIAPKQIVILSGKVTDKVTKKPVSAEIFIDELTEGKNSFSVFSDPATGTYILSMQRGHRFGLQAVAKGYLPRSERFTYPAQGTFDRTALDLELTPIEVGSMTEFKNVYFEFGKSDLLPESKLELDRVAGFLKQNKNATIEIGGHTDDVGGEDVNDKLSLARATSVMNYIVTKGIPARRLTAKGFGKTKPIAGGTDEAARAKNRRVEMLITGNAQ
jgi:outer membrane protein OmpA-like peptidoglycan-associated protein